MAADTRPFKSKEQDGQGNEVIIRDQQLVEQASQTTMASGEYFEIVDVDGRMAKIPKANMMSVVLEAIRILLDDSGSNISAANLTKILGLSASSIGNILPTDLASVLGVGYLRTTVFYDRPSQDHAHDMNDWIDEGVYKTGFSETILHTDNSPTEVTNYPTITRVYRYSDEYIVQIMYALNFGIFYRRKLNGTWDGWSKINMTSVS